MTLAAEETVDLTDAPNSQLLLAAILGIAAVVLLITLAKFHPFLALMLGTAVMGAVAGVAPLDIVNSFTLGFGATVGSVGSVDRVGGDGRQAAGRLRRKRHDRGDDHQPRRPGRAALGDGADRRDAGAPVVLRGRGGPARPRRHPGGTAPRHPDHARGDPGPGRPVDPARPGAAPPGAARRDRRARGRPGADPALRAPRRGADPGHLRPAAREVHRAVGPDARHHRRRGHDVRRPRRQRCHQPRRRLRGRASSGRRTGRRRPHPQSLGARRRGSPTVRGSSPRSSASRCR